MREQLQTNMIRIGCIRARTHIELINEYIFQVENFLFDSDIEECEFTEVDLTLRLIAERLEDIVNIDTIENLGRNIQ